jgi:hypothetical protein
MSLIEAASLTICFEPTNRLVGEHVLAYNCSNGRVTVIAPAQR